MMIDIVELPNIINTNRNASALLKHMIDSGQEAIDPVLMPLSELGYSYPDIENLLEMSVVEVVNLLESLANENFLAKKIYTTFLSCPNCGSSNLHIAKGCPVCGLDKIKRGRILEHFSCGNVKPEDEYIVNGKYVCPKCKLVVKFLGTDYRSIGVKYSCYNCGNIFDEPASIRKCLKCEKYFFEENALETTIFSYKLSREKRIRLEFDFKQKQNLVEYLRKRGYTITENAKVLGPSRSGSEHMFDLLAKRDDNLLDYIICIDVIINVGGNEIGLEDIFKFDSKTFDLGIHDRVVLVSPGLDEKAKNFADRQRIKVYEISELDNKLNSYSEIALPIKKEKYFNIRNKDQLLKYLLDNGYYVQEKARVRGRSGVEHIIDVYAEVDDGMIVHTIAIGLLESVDVVDIDKVLLFDSKAFDIGAHNKVLIVSPHMEQNARQYALSRGIKLFEFDK